MSARDSSDTRLDLGRRHLLQALLATGVAAPLAADIAAQSKGRVTVEALRQTSAMLGEELSADRLAIVERALQRNLDQFQVVRDLVLDDLVEPAPMFMARMHAGPANPRGRK